MMQSQTIEVIIGYICKTRENKRHMSNIIHKFIETQFFFCRNKVLFFFFYEKQDVS